MIAGSLTQFLISWKALDKSDYKAETDYKAEVPSSGQTTGDWLMRHQMCINWFLQSGSLTLSN